MESRIFQCAFFRIVSICFWVIFACMFCFAVVLLCTLFCMLLDEPLFLCVEQYTSWNIFGSRWYHVCVCAIRSSDGGNESQFFIVYFLEIKWNQIYTYTKTFLICDLVARWNHTTKSICNAPQICHFFIHVSKTKPIKYHNKRMT